MLNKLGKLLKYEFRFYFRILPPLYLALALIAVATRLEMILTGVEIPVLLRIYGMMATVMIVINIIMVIQRFTDNFLGDPGSLMFTLPVTVWALEASKAIAAFCMLVLSGLMVLGSGLIYAIGQEDFVFDLGINDPASFIITVFITIFMILQQLCLVYAAITASHILPRFRFAAGFAMYVAVMGFIEKPVYNLVAGGIRQTIPSGVFVNLIVNSGIPVLVASMVFAALFFWGTGFLLKRSYNLE